MIAFLPCKAFPYLAPWETAGPDRFGYVIVIWEGQPIKHRHLFVRDYKQADPLVRGLRTLEEEYKATGLSAALLNRLKALLQEAGAAHLDFARLDRAIENLGSVVPIDKAKAAIAEREHNARREEWKRVGSGVDPDHIFQLSNRER